MTNYRIIELRTYRLKPGSAQAFRALVRDVSIPMVKRWGAQVVCFRPCLHDENSYALTRPCPSLAALRSDRDAVYGSDDWRNGPRVAILSYSQLTPAVVFKTAVKTMDRMRTLEPSAFRDRVGA